MLLSGHRRGFEAVPLDHPLTVVQLRPGDERETKFLDGVEVLKTERSLRKIKSTPARTGNTPNKYPQLPRRDEETLFFCGNSQIPRENSGA